MAEKIQITFKSPDSVSMALEEYHGDLDRHEVEEIISKHVKWMEYVTIQIDLETGQAEVLPS